MFCYRIPMGFYRHFLTFPRGKTTNKPRSSPWPRNEVWVILQKKVSWKPSRSRSRGSVAVGVESSMGYMTVDRGWLMDERQILVSGRVWWADVSMFGYVWCFYLLWAVWLNQNYPKLTYVEFFSSMVSRMKTCFFDQLGSQDWFSTVLWCLTLGDLRRPGIDWGLA